MIIAIDGFSEADNIKEISRLGIDWIGLDFVADSPRRVRQLASLSGMLPDSPLLECAGLAPGSRLMGVFRDEMPQTIVTSIYNFHLDLVRLEGEESTVRPHRQPAAHGRYRHPPRTADRQDLAHRATRRPAARRRLCGPCRLPAPRPRRGRSGVVDGLGSPRALPPP